jgi:hypothetical protein
MQSIRKDKRKTTAIILVLLTTSIMLTVAPLPKAQAQLAAQQESSGPLPAGVTPNTTVTSAVYLSFRPNPVGIGQTILVNMWTTPAPETMRMLLNYKVTITKPDGTVDTKTMNSYTDDGTAWFEYTVDQLGTWKFKFDSPGTYFPAGRYFNGYIVTNSSGTLYAADNYYTPASTPESTLTVQQAMVASWPPSALPTDYWTRPISSENREWWIIGGDYPWRGPSGGSTWNALYPNTTPYWSTSYGFIPWVQGPNSAHIVWDRQGAFGGIIGGDMGQMSYTSGGGNPTIVFQGRCYQTVTKPASTTVNGTTRTQPVSVWQCYDLRTGQIYWELTDVSAPTVIEYSAGSAGPVAGSEYGISASASLVYIGGSRLIKYSPFTGAVNLNISIPLSSATYYMNGYAFSVQTINATASQYRYINWTTQGTDTNFTNRVAYNVSATLSLAADTEWDWANGVAIWTRTYRINAIRQGAAITGANIKTGQVLYDFVSPDYMYNPITNVIDHGKLAVNTALGYYNFFDEFTGKLLFKSDPFPYPWDKPGFGAYDATSAYGMLFRNAYSAIYAVSWDTGKILWKYESPNNPFETPYHDENGTGVSSWNGVIWAADGKIYASNTEHTPTQPITRGWRLHCINATTGQGIWNITGTMTIGPIVDGYMSASNTYDGYQYVFGKGQSATTVTASPKTLANGAQVMIEGTVFDQSPAQPGTPCVSKDSMSTQMEYLHMQLPIDGIWHNVTMTGVQVTLTALDQNGNPTNIGTATTSAYYGTFEMAWTTPAEGTYKIIAFFAGDDSYGSSGASTAVSVGPAPQTPVTQPTQTIPDYSTLFSAMIAAIVVAILIGLVNLVALRKRQ